jgi:glycosyltransferase involved in cell wall biosynthesis
LGKAEPEAGTGASPGRAAPLVSVIMNGFNSARYLREAIDSVLAQTYPHWELEFYDNRSEDDSLAIVRSYGDPRIRVRVSPRQLTLAEGRNAAIEGSRGEWIAFLDCDDIWMPRKLERQLARLAEDGGADVGLVYARTISFSHRGDEGETTYRYEGRALPEGSILRDLLLEGNLVPIVSALVSRVAYRASGGIPARLTFAEDYWLFTAIAARYRVLCVQEPLCRYRVHEQSATYRNKLASHVEALEVLEEWGAGLGAGDLEARRRAYQTLIGIETLRIPGRRLEGARRILARGSPAFLARGALSHLFRRYVRGRRSYS